MPFTRSNEVTQLMVTIILLRACCPNCPFPHAMNPVGNHPAHNVHPIVGPMFLSRGPTACQLLHVGRARVRRVGSRVRPSRAGVATRFATRSALDSSQTPIESGFASTSPGFPKAKVAGSIPAGGSKCSGVLSRLLLHHPIVSQVCQRVVPPTHSDRSRLPAHCQRSDTNSHRLRRSPLGLGSLSDPLRGRSSGRG